MADHAIGVAAEKSDELPFTHAYLDRAGKLAVRTPKEITAKKSRRRPGRSL